MYIRLFFLDPSVDCGCLGWIGKPGPTTNLAAGILALMIAAGGWSSLYLLWREAHRTQRA